MKLINLKELIDLLSAAQLKRLMEWRTKQLTLRGKSINFLFILSARHSAVKNKDKSWMVGCLAPSTNQWNIFIWFGWFRAGERNKQSQSIILHSFMRMKIDGFGFFLFFAFLLQQQSIKLNQSFNFIDDWWVDWSCWFAGFHLWNKWVMSRRLLSRQWIPFHN